MPLETPHFADPHHLDLLDAIPNRNGGVEIAGLSVLLFQFFQVGEELVTSCFDLRFRLFPDSLLLGFKLFDSLDGITRQIVAPRGRQRSQQAQNAKDR